MKTGKVGVSFSDHFGVPEKWFAHNGVFNPTLDIDSPLFIDPFLLHYSKHKEFSECAFESYEERFNEIFKLISGSQTVGDKAWLAAQKRFSFGEAKGLSGTCLGYSKRSTSGRGFGKVLTGKALRWAKQVIDLGVKDPELFSLMSLFEDGIGADLISDMVTSISIDCILRFNKRALNKLESDHPGSVACQPFNLLGRKTSLPENPYSKSPIILLADDVLKHLPILDDAKSLSKVAEENSELRDRVNAHIGEIFKIRSKKDKEYITSVAMKDAAAFQTLLDLLKILEKEPYDLRKDPNGLMQWKSLAQNFTAQYSLEIDDKIDVKPIERIDHICKVIIDQFQHLVEDCRLYQSFYVDGKPRQERFAQLLFYAVSVAYCDANNLDISPEADAGIGPVDFKISGGSPKVLVEIKLSTNSHVVNGFQKQLTAYMNAEKTDYGHYVVIDVGQIGNKWKRLKKIAEQSIGFGKIRRIHLIDGKPKASASHL